MTSGIRPAKSWKAAALPQSYPIRIPVTSLCVKADDLCPGNVLSRLRAYCCSFFFFFFHCL